MFSQTINSFIGTARAIFGADRRLGSRRLWRGLRWRRHCGGFGGGGGFHGGADGGGFLHVVAEWVAAAAFRTAGWEAVSERRASAPRRLERLAAAAVRGSPMAANAFSHPVFQA